MTRKPFQSINPDLSKELASFLEDYYVPRTIQALLDLAQLSVGKRGTASWIASVRAVGPLLALATDEEYARIVAATTAAYPGRSRRSSNQAVKEAGFDDLDLGDVFK